MKFLVKAVCAAIALWFVTLMPLDVAVEGGASTGDRILVFLAVGAVLAALDSLVKPILKLVSLPLLIVTLGLFNLVITWFILWLTAWITSHFSFATLTIGGFGKTLVAALLIAIVSAIVNALMPKKVKRS